MMNIVIIIIDNEQQDYRRYHVGIEEKCSKTTSAYRTLYTYSQALVQYNSTLELYCGAVLLLHSCTFLQKQYSYTILLHTVQQQLQL